MTRIKYSQIIGGLMLLSCLVTAPTFLFGAEANYATATSVGSPLLGIGAAATTLLGWLTALVAGLALLFLHRHAMILVCAALITHIVVGGPLFLPFMGWLIPREKIAFFVVNAIVTCIAVALVRWEKKTGI